jgi:hypothetical protein
MRDWRIGMCLICIAAIFVVLYMHSCTHRSIPSGPDRAGQIVGDNRDIEAGIWRMGFYVPDSGRRYSMIQLSLSRDQHQHPILAMALPAFVGGIEIAVAVIANESITVLGAKNITVRLSVRSDGNLLGEMECCIANPFSTAVDFPRPVIGDDGRIRLVTQMRDIKSNDTEDIDLFCSLIPQ